MRILFIAPFPPPITGNSLAVKVLKDYLFQFHEISQVDLSKKSFKSGFNSLGRFFEIMKLLKLIRTRKKYTDLIYFTVSESVAGNIKDLLIYLLCYRNLSKTVIHLHGGAGMRVLLLHNTGLLNRINKFFISKLAAVIILGQRHYDIYSGLLPDSKIFIVPNFAEDYLFSSELEITKKFKDTSVIRLLFMSNLIEGKGYLELLEAFSELPKNLKGRFTIDFAGGFESETDKNAFITHISHERQVRYHGTLNGEDKKKLFQSSHVFCLPTYYAYEGQPISIIEAYAAGCFVITTDHSGIFDIFTDGINGIAVKKKSSEDIKKVLISIECNTKMLLPVSLNNLQKANMHFRPSNYNQKMREILEKI